MNNFLENDLDEVYYNRFADVWASGDIYADPSGWRDTEASVADLLPTIEIDRSALGRYYLDEGDTLGVLKDQIRSLLENWEQQSLHNNEFTLYNSVSTATNAVLIALRRLGAAAAIFQTPAYGVTINQAKHAGYEVTLVPSYHKDEFSSHIEAFADSARCRALNWLTQPRMSLGFDQEPQFIAALLERMTERDYLVIDEATEQHYPSLLRSLHEHPKSDQVIRIRGLLKPLGLNGLRVAAVLHSRALRDHLENTQDTTGASLDLYSLQMAAELSHKGQLFKAMLSAANAQVRSLCKKAEAIALGSGITVSRVVNGYMGSVLVPFLDRQKYLQNRADLLEYCRSRRMPVVLGANMYFAHDPSWEQVRFNYFNRDRNIVRGIEVLTDFSRTASQQHEKHRS